MTLSILNTGYCALGTPSETPDANGVAFPPIGARCKVSVDYTSKAKLQKAAGAGKDDAKTTFTGKEVGEVDITVKWADVEPSASIMEQALLQLSPRGPNAGKAWDWTERFAAIHGAHAVIVEDLKGPKPAEGSDEFTATIKCSTWTKPANSGAGSSKTPTDPAKWTGGAPEQSNGPTAHVDADGHVQPGPAPSVPKVKP